MHSNVGADAGNALPRGPMLDPALDAALARGALVVTPNKRLAREIVSRYDRACAARQAAKTWVAARVLPWGPFVHEIMQSAQDAGLPVAPLVLDAAQSAQLWKRIVEADLVDKPLVDANAAAALALDAWEIVHAHGHGRDGWRGFSGGQDVTAFVRWASGYAAELRRLDAVDAASAPDALAAVAAQLPGVAELDILPIGFVSLSPQQQRLLDALRVAGASVEQRGADIAGEAAHARRVECATPRHELACALSWARERALTDPEATIAVVVPDLESRRAAVRAACEDALCAPLQWPGRQHEERPYDLSLGRRLAEVPLVDAALALIEVSHRPIERARVVALVRSPFLPQAASAWMRRAALERTWLERGDRSLDWRTLVADVSMLDPGLATRFARAARELPRATRLAPRAWVDRWRSWLTATGWCEGLALASDDYQAMGAWSELLTAFARLAAVAPTLSHHDALASLRALAEERVFQPASSPARIRVLGLLEATGLSFDALWLAGMDADAWPRAPDPHPMLPLAWQRERGVPRACAETELAFAREIVDCLLQAAREVVVSHAAVADEHHRGASPLIADLPSVAAPDAPAGTEARLFTERRSLETLDDTEAPSLAPGSRLPGGAGLIDKIAECPFRATAAHRLSVQPWPQASIGLTPIERGALVHAALAAFWNELRSHAALAAMDEAGLHAALARAFAAARAEVPPARWAVLPPAIAALEATCTLAVLREWIERFERPRPPFTVRAIEQRASVDLAGYTLDVRLDRVDATAGGDVVIDYKSGFASGPSRWFEPRPRGMQAALYARANAQLAPDVRVRALCYAQLRPGEVKAVGLAADASVWPGLATPADVRGRMLPDWEAAQAQLSQSLEDAARAFGGGQAAVAPRAPSSCGLCGLQSLCRIASVRETLGEAAAESRDD
jgi:probable DNA repair protein